MIEIRMATESDAEALAVLLGQLGYPVAAQEIPERLRRFTSGGNGRVFVAVAAGSVVGFAALEITFPIHRATPVAHLSALAVASSSRRQGSGGRLLEAIHSEARERGCERIVVTSAERRADAHAFYLATGWTQTGRVFGNLIA